MSDALFEPARYDKAPALFDAELAPHPHIVDAQTTARVRWDMSARPGDVVRVTTDRPRRLPANRVRRSPDRQPRVHHAPRPRVGPVGRM
jgi:hypothetical protein